jgi:hypothetical protein
VVNAARGGRIGGVLPWCGLLALTQVMLWVRLAAHCSHVRHTETISLLPTVGRELACGQMRYLSGYYINPGHPSTLLDGFLSAAGFALLGEHYLAWQWVPLLYAGLLGVGGAWLLAQVGGPRAAGAFLLLLAASPFLVKDGLLAMVGYHASGVVFGVAALALAVGASPHRTFDRRAFAAGVVLGMGVFYLRTSVAAVPAVGLAVLAGGRRSVRDMALGTLSFPVLLACTAVVRLHGLALEKSPRPLVWGDVTHSISWAFPTSMDGGTRPPLELSKLGDLVAWPLIEALFAQPPALETGIAPVHGGLTLAGGIWVLGWILAALLVVPLVLWLLGDGGRIVARDAYRPLVVAALPLTYAALYVVAPFRIDEAVLAGEYQSTFTAPPVEDARYLMPVLLLWGLPLAMGLGLALRAGAPSWQRLPALGLGGLLLLSGGGFALADLGAGDPAGTLAQLQPFTYRGFHRSDRGLERRQHAYAPTDDPLSRGNHLRAVGAFDRPPVARTATEPHVDHVALQEVDRELQLDALDRQFVAHGMGSALGDSLHHGEGWDIPALAQMAMAAADAMPPDEGRAYLRGLGEAIRFDLCPVEDPAPAAEALCQPMANGERPLCFALGGCLGWWDRGPLPWRPVGLFPDHRGWVAGQDPEVVSELIRGVGWTQGAALPPSMLFAIEDPGWEGPAFEAFVDGWHAGSSHVWRWPEERYPVDPWYQP